MTRQPGKPGAAPAQRVATSDRGDAKSRRLSGPPDLAAAQLALDRAKTEAEIAAARAILRMPMF
jgi:hypothetical protein